MKANVLVIFLLLSVAGYSQNNLNSYKYVIVPDRFTFFKDADQYNLNSSTKLLLQQRGFIVFKDNENLPADLLANKCGALRADITNRNTMFTTNLTLVLKDCMGSIVFKGKEGKSREKDFQMAYDEALSNAIAALDNVHYKYDSALAGQPQQPAAVPAAVASTTTAPAAVSTVAAVPAQTPAKADVADVKGVLYAQAISNGYQLIDTSPKKVLTLLKTSAEDYFIAEGATSNGIVFKKNGEWFFEYYKEDKLVSRKLEIKF